MSARANSYFGGAPRRLEPSLGSRAARRRTLSSLTQRSSVADLTQAAASHSFRYTQSVADELSAAITRICVANSNSFVNYNHEIRFRFELDLRLMILHHRLRMLQRSDMSGVPVDNGSFHSDLLAVCGVSRSFVSRRSPQRPLSHKRQNVFQRRSTRTGLLTSPAQYQSAVSPAKDGP